MKKLILLLLVIVSIQVNAQTSTKGNLYLGGGINKYSNILAIKKTGYASNFVFVNLNYTKPKYQIGTNLSTRNIALYISFKIN